MGGIIQRAVQLAAASFAIMTLLLCSIVPAQAQLLDQLKNGVQSGQNGGGVTGGGGLGGLSGGLPSVGQASPGNTAGVLQYCVRNNYVDNGAAASAKNSLMSKIGGSSQGNQNGDYQAGNKGILNTGGGQTYSLGGGGVKAQVTQKVCGMVLQHAKSLL